MSDYVTRCRDCHLQFLKGVEHSCPPKQLRHLREAVRDWIESGDPGHPPERVKELLSERTSS